jgi:hypothetical protein
MEAEYNLRKAVSNKENGKIDNDQKVNNCKISGFISCHVGPNSV